MERYNRLEHSGGSIRAALLFLVLAVSPQTELLAEPGDECIIIHGLGGMPEFEENFVKWSTELSSVFQQQVGARVEVLDGRTVRRDQIILTFQQVTERIGPDSSLWLFLIGHANHDGEEYKFHIKGPDLTGSDLSGFLSSLGNRRIFVVAATSASGVLLPRLSGDNRVVITATKNEFERQPPLFLSFFLEATTSAEADTDKNKKVSLLEAYTFAEREVVSWYAENGRLQTEHPRLDDRSRVLLEGTESNQDNRAGTGMLAAVAFLSAPPESAYRSERAAELAARRTGIERQIEDLKFRKSEFPTDEYYRKLEELLVEVASLNEEIATLEAEP